LLIAFSKWKLPKIVLNLTLEPIFAAQHTLEIGGIFAVLGCVSGRYIEI
jgi:hypothetical protein